MYLIVNKWSIHSKDTTYMNRSNNCIRALVISGLSASLLLPSCKLDETYSYDKVKNVDTEMTLFENGLSIPLIESTAQIRVDSLMKLAGLDTLDFIERDYDGNYSLKLNGDFDLSEQLEALDLAHVVKINALSFTEKHDFTLTDFDTSLIPPISIGEITIPDLSYEIDKEFHFDLMAASDIPEMLVSVSEVTLDDVYITVSLDINDLPGVGQYELCADVVFPDFIVPRSVSIKDEITEGKTVTECVRIEKFDLSKFDFAKMRAENTSLGGQISIAAKASASNVVISDVNELTGNKIANIKIQIADKQNRIDINSVKAKVDYQVDTTINLAFIKFPDALKDAELDLPDVDMTLVSSTNLAIPLDCSASLGSKGASAADAISIDFSIPYCTNPAEISSLETKNTFSINNILNDMPDSISFRAKIAVDKTRDCIVVPSANYSLNLAYSLSAPFTLGSETYIPYCDTIRIGDADTAEIIAKVLEENSIKLSGAVENDLPLSVSVKFEFLAYDEASGSYAKIPLGKEIGTELIKAGKTSDFALVIGPEGKNEALKGFTHLRLLFEIESDGSQLSAGKYVKVTGLSLTLPEGLTFDPANL